MRGQRGQSWVELCLTLPFLVLLVGLGVDAARLFYTQQAMTNAAHAAALYAARYPNATNADITQVVQEEGLLDPSHTTVTGPTQQTGPIVNTVTVTLDYNFTLFVSAFNVRVTHLTASSTESVQFQ
ncbi:MAG: TadE/TadG family type IV pilus assembly protein [Candidatus Dormibacteria bacterium]